MILLLSIYLIVSLVVDYTRISDTPQKSDVIIIVEGGFPERVRQAAKLLKEGYSTSGKAIMSPYIEEIESMYFESGLEEKDIIPEYEATSTYYNAVNTLTMMKELDYQSAIIVTDECHMPRTRMIFERVNFQYKFDLIYIFPEFSKRGSNNILEKDEKTSRKEILREEIKKYLGYKFFLYRYLDL
ncbi:YdcF family protein [Facklamia sp. DSM 111018]|uniref:YdcF family protein n=2 Tax=Facklamia lactis TaxID=2749967 RepID=A0ABS0LML1_9LACT|nr:YdcF family protein [Facklamia lactis]MBG9979941.1 YdcF family protein [Facklamia lactis]MBG9985379.1 YdcF family protein [Facklamia lactis]